jgi:hypothetical protein
MVTNEEKKKEKNKKEGLGSHRLHPYLSWVIGPVGCGHHGH